MGFAEKMSNKNRLKKYKIFMDYFVPDRQTKILDVGASEREFQESANLLEKKYPYPENITAVGIEKYEKFRNRYPKVHVVAYDGGWLPFEDKEFDICWCNAVIEHVGGISKQIAFLKEVHRVAKRTFVTTPNRWFPIEVHTRIPFFHYLPKQVFDFILRKSGKKWASGDYMHLLGLKDIRALLKKSGVTRYKIIRNRFFCFTLDFVIMF